MISSTRKYHLILPTSFDANTTNCVWTEGIQRPV
ncbi:hypothetical protein SALBM311S_03286 [Streptomyces alboniger]